MRQGLDKADKLASVGGLLIALVTLLLTYGPSLVRSSNGQTNSKPEVLEVLAETIAWEGREEEQLRRLHDPEPLPAHWHAVGPPVSDYWLNIRTDGEGSPLAIDGRFSGISQLFVYKLQRPRLVILGDAGSGKTALATRLMLDTIAGRSKGDPVPVLISLSTWNPGSERLASWVAQRLSVDYSAMHDKENTAKLIRSGLIVPVLDGLDEMPVQHQALAIKSINSLGAQYPLILTSRGEEYRELVANADVLTGAAVIQLERLAPLTVCSYLRRSTPPSREAEWERVFKRITQRPRGHLAAALSTPLAISLVRSNYESAAASPAELLDRKFKNENDILLHLIARLVPSVFPGPPADSYTDSRKAEDSLGFFADELRRTKSPYISWWDVAEAAGGGASLMMFLIWLIGALIFWQVGNVGVAIVYFMTAMGVGALFQYKTMTAPLIVSLNPRRFVRPFLRVLGLGSALGVINFPFIGDPNVIYGGIAVGFGGGIVLGISEAFTAPVDVARASSPIATLRSERRISIITGAFIGFLIGALYSIADGATHGLIGFAAGIIGGLSGILCGHWGGFLLARVVLSIREKTPLRLMLFWDIAHKRGVLRQSGASYQFRHSLLQGSLAPERQVPLSTRRLPQFLAPRYNRPLIRLMGFIVGGMLLLPAGYISSIWSEPLFAEMPSITRMIVSPWFAILLPAYGVSLGIRRRNLGRKRLKYGLFATAFGVFGMCMVWVIGADHLGAVSMLLILGAYVTAMLLIAISSWARLYRAPGVEAPE
jgi:NACHT domain-containing protein